MANRDGHGVFPVGKNATGTPAADGRALTGNDTSNLGFRTMNAPTPTPGTTIEIGTAEVHLAGKFAGMIEVPLIIQDLRQLDADLDELFLQVEGETHLLRPAGRVYFNNELRLTFYSKHVRKTAHLPQSIQLHWGDCLDHDQGGMRMPIQVAEIKPF